MVDDGKREKAGSFPYSYPLSPTCFHFFLSLASLRHKEATAGD